MKTIYTLLFFVLVLGLVACQAEDDTSMKNTGYLSMDITTNNSTATKAGSEEVVYNPKQLAVQILNDQGGVVKETDSRRRRSRNCRTITTSNMETAICICTERENPCILSICRNGKA